MMRRVLVYAILLFTGLALSQALPELLGGAHDAFATLVRVLTMTGLAYIMIHVGFEFHVDTSKLGQYGWGMIALHVLLVTILSSIGKMFPAFVYRDEAHWRHRLAVAIGMWPRGGVGAGVLVLSLSYGIGGPIVTVAMRSLALNLALTGVFILIVKALIAGTPEGVQTS